MVGSVRYASKYVALALVLVILVQLPFAQPVSQLWAGRRHTTLDTTGSHPFEGSLCGIRHNPTFNLPFARAPLQHTRLWTSNYTWHAKAQIVAVKRWYHDNDLSTHMLTLQQALPSPHASGDAASTAGRPRWLMGIYQSNLHSAESCSLPNWQQLPPDSLSAMALAATTWHAAASTVHKSMPLDNHSDTIQMLHTRTRKGAHETLECINTSDKDAHRYKGTHAWHGEATQLYETGDSGERRVDSQMELIQVLRCIASGSCCRVFSATQLAIAALEALLAWTITLISVSAGLKATGCRGRAVKYMLPARRALGVLTKQADLCPRMLRYQKRLRHVRHRALRWFTHARAPCRRCKRSAVREQRYMERQLNRLHVKVMRYEQRTLVASTLPMPLGPITQQSTEPTTETSHGQCPDAGAGSNTAGAQPQAADNPPTADTDKHAACWGGGADMKPPHHTRAAARGMQLPHGAGALQPKGMAGPTASGCPATPCDHARPRYKAVLGQQLPASCVRCSHAAYIHGQACTASPHNRTGAALAGR